MLATNVTGLITLTQAVTKVFKTRPEGGRGDIINIGSIAGREGYPGGSIYCATKAAVRTFTDALRKELIDTRIRVMEIDPGQVETEFSVVRFGGDKEKAAKVYEGVEPLTPDDIAEVIVFMAGRRENVVVADVMVFPSHQVSLIGVGRWSVLDWRECADFVVGIRYADASEDYDVDVRRNLELSLRLFLYCTKSCASIFVQRVSQCHSCGKIVMQTVLENGFPQHISSVA